VNQANLSAHVDPNGTTGEALASVPGAQAILEQHGCPADWTFWSQHDDEQSLAAFVACHCSDPVDVVVADLNGSMARGRRTPVESFRGGR
jgi:hypothetical protein